LALEIGDPAERARIQRDLATRLVSNIQLRGLYPYSIEAFRTLGPIGIAALNSCVNDSEGLRSVFAEAESHLVSLPAGAADEAAWRRIGRAIYILGELGDTTFLQRIERDIDELKSVHFLYHIGEAVFTLARCQKMAVRERRRISRLLTRLRVHRLADPVVSGHLLAASWALGDTKNGNGVAVSLEKFLLTSCSPSNPHFRAEFWRRAHGIEAMAEISNPQRCLKVFTRIFEVEDVADYADYPEAGYRLVQSSLLKAIVRSCEDSTGKRDVWKELLEQVFTSRRIAENGWACRHLEQLLALWYSSPEDLMWVRNWSQSPSLGGSTIANTLRNVIWLSN
jgi:hypothetical protein